MVLKFNLVRDFSNISGIHHFSLSVDIQIIPYLWYSSLIWFETSQTFLVFHHFSLSVDVPVIPYLWYSSLIWFETSQTFLVFHHFSLSLGRCSGNTLPVVLKFNLVWDFSNISGISPFLSLSVDVQVIPYLWYSSLIWFETWQTFLVFHHLSLSVDVPVIPYLWYSSLIWFETSQTFLVFHHFFLSLGRCSGNTLPVILKFNLVRDFSNISGISPFLSLSR